MKYVCPISCTAGVALLFVASATAAPPQMLQQWCIEQSSFANDVLVASQDRSASPSRPLEFDDEDLLVFSEGQYLVVDEGSRGLPASSFSVEAWVRIDRATRWGCIFGFQQDNGRYEHGWSLGYNNDRFEFRCSDGTRIVNATATDPMKLGQWHHVVGVCDVGRGELRLYVDGMQCKAVHYAAETIAYPDPVLNTELVIGAYKDKDELFPMQGRLREIRLYEGVVNTDFIAAHVQLQQRVPDKPLQFSVRPGVRFLTPTTAEVRWETTIAGPSTVAYGQTRRLGEVAVSQSRGTSHRVALSNLEPGEDYWYRFELSQISDRSASPTYQLEGDMNYSPPVVENPGNAIDVSSILGQLDQLGGFAVVDTNIDPLWSESMASATSMTVIAAVDDDLSAKQLRGRWYDQDIYGIRLTVQMRGEIPDRFANVVIANGANLQRAIKWPSPSGVMVALGRKPNQDEFAWREVSERVWLGRQTSESSRLASWGHQYGSIGNASFSGETLGGVDDAADLEMKWIGRPGADFGIDRNPRMPAPLAVGGRLFHQGMNRMIALDAFNGSVLWSLEIPDLRRVNIPRDCANWCADQSHVLAAVKDRLWVIDAASGDMLRTLLLPEQYAQGFEWGFVAATDDTVLGTAMKSDSVYSSFWDKAAWYDGKSDAATAKVCGDAIMAYEKKYGSLTWHYLADAIVHSTIAVSGERVYFVKVDDPSLQESQTGRLANSQIWESASVVCLDLKTGHELWKSKVPAQRHEAVISFGLCDTSQYILQTSGKNQFHFVSLDASTGRQAWTQSVDWPEDHHGAHIQHAVLMNGRIYVQPHILDATNGQVVKSGTLGKRRGCATPVGAGNTIIFRGGSGPLSMWSLDDEARSEFTRLRSSCWLSAIPAQGMLFSPEGGGGCSCGGWMETSIGFAPVARETIE